MKPWFYSHQFNASKMIPATLDSALVDVCDIAHELTSYRGRLGDFAFSTDSLDRGHAEALRKQIAILAWNVVVGDMTDNEIAQVHAALAHVCSADEYAAKELAGRFLSSVRRVRVLRAIGQHPRANRFDSLTDAIEKGRHTKAQWAFALRLAAEVGQPIAA